MTLSYRPGMFLGFKYHVNLNDYFALRFGTNLGLQAFRFDFDPGHNDTVTYAPVFVSVAKPYMGVPIELIARFRIKQRHVLGVVAGASINVVGAEKITANASLTGNLNGPERYKMELKYERPNPFVNVEAGLEYLLVLRSMDMVSFGLKYSLGVRQILYAQYEHSENDLVLSSGSFNSYNNHLCVSIGYVFTRVNKLQDK
jgi:hypothetical protein